jgi:hypothetical protein
VISATNPARVSLANYRRERPGYANRTARKHQLGLRLVTRLASGQVRAGVRLTSESGNWSTEAALSKLRIAGLL